jgi:antitoxin FitA
MAIRYVRDEVCKELAARAIRRGRSLQEHLLAELVEIARRPSAEDALARARAWQAAGGAR